MSEIATRNTAELDVSAPTIMTGPASKSVDLAAWAMELTAAHQIGTALCRTAFVPKDFQGKPDAAAAAILAGKSLGMDPLAALQNIFVIHGRPGLYARTMHALVTKAGHEVIRTNAQPDSVTVKARRKGVEEWSEFTWTIQRATLAGYVKTNAKYKDNPIEMLTAKALAEACRVIAPDVLTGVAVYAVEELEDMGEKPKPKGAGAGLTALQAVAEPEPEPAPVVEVLADEDGVIDAEPDWTEQAEAARGNVPELQRIYAEAEAAGAEPADLDYIKAQA